MEPKPTPKTPGRGPVADKLDELVAQNGGVSAPGPEDDPIELLDADQTLVEWGLKSRTSLYRHMETGVIPRPIKIGPNTVRWVKSEQRRAKLRLIAQRGAV